MKKTWIVAAAVVALAMAGPVFADQAGTGLPGAVETEVTSVTATVTDINHETRMVTLQGTDGKVVTLKVDPRARNLDQVQKGDKVNISYAESVAIFVQPASEGAVSGQQNMIQLAPKGAMPGGIMVNTNQITATVEAIDYKNRTVTIKGPEGRSVTLKVNKDVTRFDQVKKGDQIVARYTEAVALSVTKP